MVRLCCPLAVKSPREPSFSLVEHEWTLGESSASGQIRSYSESNSSVRNFRTLPSVMSLSPLLARETGEQVRKQCFEIVDFAIVCHARHIPWLLARKHSFLYSVHQVVPGDMNELDVGWK